MSKSIKCVERQSFILVDSEESCDLDPKDLEVWQKICAAYDKVQAQMAAKHIKIKELSEEEVARILSQDVQKARDERSEKIASEVFG